MAKTSALIPRVRVILQIDLRGLLKERMLKVDKTNPPLASHLLALLQNIIAHARPAREPLDEL